MKDADALMFPAGRSPVGPKALPEILFMEGGFWHWYEFTKKPNLSAQ